MSFIQYIENIIAVPFHIKKMLKTTTIAAVALSASAAELHRAIDGTGLQGEYIVRLREPSNGTELQSEVNKLVEELGDHITSKSTFSALAQHGFPAFSAHLSEVGLSMLLRHDAVQYIEEIKETRASDCQQQTDADWGTVRTNIRYAFLSECIINCIETNIRCHLDYPADRFLQDPMGTLREIQGSE